MILEKISNPKELSSPSNRNPQPYLGDRATLQVLARSAAQEFVELRLETSEPERGDNEKSLSGILIKYSSILRGKKMNYKPVPNWNVDGGGLPLNVARRWNFSGNSDEVVQGGIALFFQDLLQAEEMAEEGLEFDYIIDGAIELQVAVWLGTDHIEFPE